MTRRDKWYDERAREFHWHIVIEEADVTGWERERLDMFEDGMFLIGQALVGNVDGPLTLPRTGLPLRVRSDG